MTASIIVLRKGHTWGARSDAAPQGGLGSVVSAIFILLAAGGLIGTWNMSGTIPTLSTTAWTSSILKLELAVASLIVCAPDLAPWDRQLVDDGRDDRRRPHGPRHCLPGVSPPSQPDAVVAGAYIGDKLSPLSETTILAAQLTDNDLYVHLRYQAWVSVPARHRGNGPDRDQVWPRPSPGADISLINPSSARSIGLFWITPINLLPLLLLIVHVDPQGARRARA